MTYWIADICSNHNQNLQRTKELILSAAEAGCDAVKLQLFKANKLYAPQFKEQRKKMAKWEFPEKWLEDISDHCKYLNIKFGCTPFDLDAVETLKPYVDFYKIGSYENQWVELIKRVIATKKDWMISAGMMQLINIQRFMDQHLIQKNKPKALFMCNSTYPAKAEECNLKTINYCNNFMKADIGWSDHTNEPGVIYKAVSEGAKYIEFHLDLNDKKGFESEIGHCWTPNEIRKIIYNVKKKKKAVFRDDLYDVEAKKWRTDIDGFRPLKKWREELCQ